MKDESSAADGGTAPVILFDAIEAMGQYDGIAHITVSAQRFGPDGAGRIATKRVVVGHLRMTLPALSMLKQAVQNIEMILQPVEGEKN